MGQVPGPGAMVPVESALSKTPEALVTHLGAVEAALLVSLETVETHTPQMVMVARAILEVVEVLVVCFLEQEILEILEQLARS